MVISDADIERFQRDGFFCHTSPLATSDEIETIRSVIDGLFERVQMIPRDWHGDLGDHHLHEGTQQIPEILHPTLLAPSLRATSVFRGCEAIARQVLGGAARLDFDHAIYKGPYNGRATSWHQDEAYAAPSRQRRRRVHMWIALQDVPEAAGCLVYLPGSHRGPLLDHHRAAPDSHALAAEAVDQRLGVACPLPAGGITMHDPMTAHFAGPNMTGDVRRAWILQFAVRGLADRARPAALAASVSTSWNAATARRKVSASGLR